MITYRDPLCLAHLCCLFRTVREVWRNVICRSVVYFRFEVSLCNVMPIVVIVLDQMVDLGLIPVSLFVYYLL